MANTNINYLNKWSDLPKDLLDLILAKMSPISIYNSKGACSSWRSTVKTYISSPIFYSTPYKVPWLMFFPELKKDKFSFYSLDEKKVYKRMDRPQDFDICLCIGSSHGWLVMLDEKADPYLFNPFTLARIQLPSFETYPDVLRVSKSDDNNFHVKLRECPLFGEQVLKYKSVKGLIRRMILNAVLSSNPSHGNFFVLISLDYEDSDCCRVAFYHSRETKWMRIEDRCLTEWSEDSYTYFICYNDKFIALKGTSVHFWDIVDSSPIKRAEVKASLPKDYSNQINYLVELFGDLFLVKKLIQYNRHTNKHMTFLFRIYKRNFSMTKWEEVDSLGDYALLLDGNQFKFISGCDIPEFEVNSIDFTNDIWDKIINLGVFNIEDKTIKSYHQCNSLIISELPPIWIYPNSLLDV